MEMMKIGQKLVSTWTICGHNMVIMWTPCSFQVDTTLFPHGHQVVSTLAPHGFYMDTMCCPGKQMESSTKTALHEANWLPC